MKSDLWEEFMKIANLENVDIAYLDEGEGQPILLIHGFSSNANTNWVGPGWVKTLSDAGFRVIALDNRGHGASQKFYDQQNYSLDRMADDAGALLNYLDIEQSHVMGYSMGSRISAALSSRYPELINKLVLAGNGYNMIEGGFESSEIYDGLTAETMDAVTTKIGLEFRAFAEQTKSDLKALAACIMGGRSYMPKQLFETIRQETLIIVGTQDTVAVDGKKLASIIPNAQFTPIPGRNHMNAVGDKIYKQEVLKFLMG